MSPLKIEPLKDLDSEGMPNRDKPCIRAAPATSDTPAIKPDHGKGLYKAHAIIICDATFDGTIDQSLDDILDGEDQVQVSSPLEAQQFPGKVLLHETMHIVSDDSS